MSNLNKLKDLSPLVQSVVALDNYFFELNRLSEKIDGMELKSEFDFEQTERLMKRFAECGQAVAAEVSTMSQALNEARSKAEAAAKLVAVRSELLQFRQEERQSKMDEFQQLAEKVQNLTLSLNDLRRPEGTTVSDEDRAKISMRLSECELQLRPLIEEAQQLKEKAQESKMKVLEHGADSLRQSLMSIRQKLSVFQQSDHSVQ